MEPAPSRRALLVRHRRRALVVASVILVPYVAHDLADAHTALTLSARAVWIATMLGAAALQREGGRWADAAARFAAAIVAAPCAVIVGVHGGTAGVYGGLLSTLPFAVCVVFPDLPSTSALSAVVTGAAGALVMRLEGRSVVHVVEWVLFSAALDFVCVWGHAVYARAWITAERAERERTRAVEELAASERRRGEAERLALVGRLAAGVAHEINNPLAYVKANAEWLQAEAQGGKLGGADARDALAATVAGAERIGRIVEDLRLFARPDEPSVRACAVDEVVRDALRLASLRLKSVDEVRVDVPPGLPAAEADARKLSQAVVNLLVNAADALEASAGRRPSAPRRVRIGARADGEHVEIAVDDSGEGLAPEVAAHLFEPFYSTKGPRGTGLGLAVSRENLATFGATLQAGASGEGGARFTIRLRQAR